MAAQIFPDEVVRDVKGTWATINSDLQSVGYVIFKRLFAAYPDYQQLFKAFKDVPTDALENNESYRKHALNVANALNSAIENLENPEKLVCLLKSVGEKHVKRNVTAEHYTNVQEIVLDVIKSSLGDRSNDKIMSSWDKVLTVAVSTIQAGTTEEEAKFL